MREPLPPNENSGSALRDYEQLLPRVLAAMYPQTPQRERVEKLLKRYGTKRFHQEPARVRLGVLRLASDHHDDENKLKSLIDFACEDFRDLLVAAEYPLSARKYQLSKTDPDQYRNLQAKEAREYDNWLTRTLGKSIDRNTR
ncbi:MAG: hypothetical protein AAGH99_16095 [Planctomycetota bacterium]